MADVMLVRSGTAAAMGAASGPPVWFWGVLLCVFGSTLTALGLVIQKYSHMENDCQNRGVVYYKQPWWLFGFSIFLIAQLLNLTTMSMAPQVMLSSLGAWSLISNATFACGILGEKLRWLEVVAMVGVVCSALMVILSTPSVDQRYVVDGDIRNISARFTEPMFGSVVFGLMAFTGSACLFTFQACPSLVPFFWAFVCAVASGFTTMLYKCVSLLVVAAPPGLDSPWMYPQTYAILIAAALLSVTQMHTLNLALQAGDATTVVPAYYSLGMLSQILTAAVFFKELAFAASSGIVVFWGGVVSLLVCVAWMTRLHMESEEQEDDAGGASAKEVEPTAPLLGPTPPSKSPVGARSRLSLPTRKSSVGRVRAISGLDIDSYPDSFLQGRGRSYTVSVTGPMGVA